MLGEKEKGIDCVELNLNFGDGEILSKDYYNAYVWCCIAEMKDIDDTFDRVVGGIGLGTMLAAGASWLFAAPATPIIGAVYLLVDVATERSIKEQIEGKGIFNLAKLSDSQMESAKYEAEKIARQIRELLKAKQQQ